MNKRFGSSLALSVAMLAAVGCGKHDTNTLGMDAGNSTAGTLGLAGTSAGGGGASGGTSTGTAGSAGAAGAGGAAGTVANQANCDTTVTSVPACGTQTCPMSGGAAAFTCRVNCCVSTNECGTRVASLNAMRATTCTAPAQADPRCEDLALIATGGGVFGGGGGGGNTRMYKGCCTAQNQCGGLSGRMGQCVSRADLATRGTGIPAPRACDAAGDDAGI